MSDAHFGGGSGGKGEFTCLMDDFCLVESDAIVVVHLHSDIMYVS